MKHKKITNKSINACIEKQRRRKADNVSSIIILVCLLLSVIFSFGLSEWMNENPFFVPGFLVVLVVMFFSPRLFLRNWYPTDEKLKKLVEKELTENKKELERLGDEQTDLNAFLSAKKWKDAGLGGK